YDCRLPIRLQNPPKLIEKETALSRSQMFEAMRTVNFINYEISYRPSLGEIEDVIDAFHLEAINADKSLKLVLTAYKVELEWAALMRLYHFHEFQHGETFFRRPDLSNPRTA